MYFRGLVNEALAVIRQPAVDDVTIYVDNKSLLPISSGRLARRTRHMHVKGTWTTGNLHFRYMCDIILGSARTFDWETFESEQRQGRHSE